VAKESLLHALVYATAHRKIRKREQRSLAITRINAAARQNGLTYRELMHGLKQSSVELNRKVLAELAIREPAAFAEVVSAAKSALSA
jgi:large subunit ribosomal protein L20